jgi:hypothetical protein
MPLQSTKPPTWTVAPFKMGAKKGSRGISRCHDAMQAGERKSLLSCSEGMLNMTLSVGSCSELTSYTRAAGMAAGRGAKTVVLGWWTDSDAGWGNP